MENSHRNNCFSGTIIQCRANCENNEDGICTKRTVKQGFYLGYFECDMYEPKKD